MAIPTTYLAGINTVDITPPIGTTLGGFAARGRHASTGIDHPLRAVVISLGDGDQEVLLVSIEWLGAYEDLADIIAAEIVRRTGLPRSHIMINSSHTHCGPAVREADKHWHGWIDEDHRRAIVQRIATAAARAFEHRFPAVVKSATGHCTVAMNRRLPDPDRPGQVARQMLPNPDGARDHAVPVITIESTDDQVTRAVLFSYACHPTSRGGLRVSGDYVGFALDAVGETFPNAQPAFLQGCGGDQKPRPASEGGSSFGLRTLEQVRQIGDELAEAVVAAVANAEPVTGPIRAGFDAVRLRSEPVTAEAVAELVDSSQWYQREWAEQWGEQLTAGGPAHSEIDLELQVIALGSELVIIGMGAEMTVEHGLRLKQDLSRQFGSVVPLGYSNTMIGYVPVARQFDEFGYEVLDANQYAGYSGRFVRETEDEIHSRVAGLVDDLS